MDFDDNSEKQPSEQTPQPAKKQPPLGLFAGMSIKKKIANPIDDEKTSASKQPLDVMDQTPKAPRQDSPMNISKPIEDSIKVEENPI